MKTQPAIGLEFTRVFRPAIASFICALFVMASWCGLRGESEQDGEDGDPAASGNGLELEEFLSPDGERGSGKRMEDMTLEELLGLPETSSSKRPQKRFDSAAAIHTISGDDIRRSGARTFPEALRLAPGIAVAQVDANNWAVGSRGFSGIFADKLLVLVDGRSVYTPYWSGVFWSFQDYLLEDVDRIEVIRGSGGTLWGANAVNGVINIITKPAEETQGLYMLGGVGTHERGFGGIRYGQSLGVDGSIRAYLKYHDHDSYKGGVDQWDSFQAGFRADWEFVQSRFTVSGDIHDGDTKSRVAFPNLTDPMQPRLLPMEQNQSYRGGNLRASYEYRFNEESDLKLEAYYDRLEIDRRGARQDGDAFDVNFQHRFPLPLGQNVMYGLGYRYAPSNLRDDPQWQWEPNEAENQLFSAFIQDEITLIDDPLNDQRLRLILGTKVEHNDFTGWELQPNARISWQPARRQTVWAAVSRAVQVPARNFRELRIPLIPSAYFGETDLGPPLGPVPVFGSATEEADLDAQVLVGYELGYRVQPTDNLSFDFAVFFNDYDNLTSRVVGSPFLDTDPTPHLKVPLSAANGGEAYSWGGEVVADWHITDYWRLQAHYSLLQLEADSGASSLEGMDPEHMFSLRSSLDLPGDFYLDLWGRYVDNLAALDVSGYYDLDARLAWSPRDDLEIALVGQNLLAPDRMEYGGSDLQLTQITPVPRGGYLTVSLRF